MICTVPCFRFDVLHRVARQAVQPAMPWLWFLALIPAFSALLFTVWELLRVGVCRNNVCKVDLDSGSVAAVHVRHGRPLTQGLDHSSLALQGPYLVVYKNIVGPCRNTPNVCNQLLRMVIKAGLVSRADAVKSTLVGVFFDNPWNTPDDLCRSSVGWVFKSGNDLSTPEDISYYKEWLQNCKLVQSGQLKVAYIPVTSCHATSYPISPFLHIIMAILRVFPPMFQAFIKEWNVTEQEGLDKQQMLSALEVYLLGERRMWISLPMINKMDLKPFDVSEGELWAGSRQRQGVEVGREHASMSRGESTVEVAGSKVEGSLTGKLRWQEMR